MRSSARLFNSLTRVQEVSAPRSTVAASMNVAIFDIRTPCPDSLQELHFAVKFDSITDDEADRMDILLRPDHGAGRFIPNDGRTRERRQEYRERHDPKHGL